MSKPSSKRLLLSEESVEDDFENEDEEGKAPLIKESRLVPSNGRVASGKKIRFKLSNGTSSLAEDEDGDGGCSGEEGGQSKHSLNTAPPITIGKVRIFQSTRRHRALRFRRFVKRCFALLVFALGLLLLAANANRLPELIRFLLGVHTARPARKDIEARCDQVASEPVWRQNFPMLTVESSLRLLHVNNDSVLDVIVPFGTGIDAAYYDSVLCQIYFNQTEAESKGCGGGVMAVDGRSGEPLWAQYTAHELFAANCDADLNNDGHKDCVIGGRMASLFALNGRSGQILWSVGIANGEPVTETSNFYTPLLVPRDVDGDSISDLVVMHGGDPLRKANEKVRNVARLMVVSGKTGQILNWIYVPGNAESYYSPQLLVHPDGTLLVLFGTGGETHPGGLYIISLDSLVNGQVEHGLREIFQDCCKGVITPPVLVDINGDSICDIVLAHYNSTVMAFDGLTFELLWSRQFAGSETYSTPSVGYFNNDDVPDFGVTYQFGPGFPIYYYAQFQVLDGRKGNPLLKQPVQMAIGTQSSPLTVSTLAQNDLFLFWYSSCSNSSVASDASNDTTGHSELANMGSFQIEKGSSVHEASRADFCKIRFGKQVNQFTQYRAITANSMTSIYDSRTDEPLVEKRNDTQKAYQWYRDYVLNGVDTEEARNRVDLPNGAWAPDSADGTLVKDSPLLNQFEQLKKYKKWPSERDQPEQFEDQILSAGFRQRRSERRRRHVGLHNGDSIQRVISTGTLAPTFKPGGHSTQDQLPVDGSIDVLFATYSFPASTKVRRLSEAMRACVESYMTPEKETELRLMEGDSLFKRLGYDHDAYESAVHEMCAKETNQGGQGDSKAPGEETVVSDDPVKANEWARQMGSMTLHRVNLKCFDSRSRQQVAIKEYHYQWWPSYLGVNADSVANVLD